ncbi:aldolase/citrate lyase family protein [Myxococcota bacterium]|nr:aldolase/citrate lyase family protein [Myxococcota bacterium]
MSALERRYRRGLAEGRQVTGVFCCLDGFATSHLLAAAGFDFLIFDRQHAAYTWPELEQLCFRVRSEGASPFIRVASTEEAELNLALDLPVDGIVLPNLVSAEDTRRALSFCKFPPEGVRSLGNERHDAIWGAYSQPEPLVGMLVEHPGAVEELDEILQLAIDFVWVGAHDLSALMGLDPHEAFGPDGRAPELEEAYQKIKATAQKHGVVYWDAPGSPDAAVVFGGVDARMFSAAAEKALAQARGT